MWTLFPAFLSATDFYLIFRNFRNMKNQYPCALPSFDSLPYIHKDNLPIQQSMLFIMSHKDPDSHQSLEHLLPETLPNKSKLSSVSILCSQEQIVGVEKKEQHPIRTEDSFRVPVRKKMGCVCKKTGCIKLYCECFRKGEACGEECSCCNCNNTNHNKQAVDEIRCTRRKRSKNSQGRPYCNCKKTECQKKYCECFNAGVGCAKECRCSGCSNQL